MLFKSLRKGLPTGLSKEKSKKIVVMDKKEQKIRVNSLAQDFTDISTEPCSLY